MHNAAAASQARCIELTLFSYIVLEIKLTLHINVHFCDYNTTLLRQCDLDIVSRCTIAKWPPLESSIKSWRRKGEELAGILDE